MQPGQPDPKLTPEPPGVPPGVGTLFSEIFPGEGQLSIDGGPVSISLGPVPMEQVATALDTGDAAALFAIEREYAPFWCPSCGCSYSREHYRAWAVYDDGFFDCFQGVCPKGHERMLGD